MWLMSMKQSGVCQQIEHILIIHKNNSLYNNDYLVNVHLNNFLFVCLNFQYFSNNIL
jgi:hypothetical protein